jgi:IS5 family transposase
MSFEPKQIEMVCLEDLVPANHIYRKFQTLWNLEPVRKELEKLESDSDHKGYGIFRMFLCLLLQFVEDLSDRELEKFICENSTARWFCQFGLTGKTPDHTVFSRAREKIGASKLSQIFSMLRQQLKSQGYISEVFTFIDATHLISKANLWKERDEVIEKKLKQLKLINNQTSDAKIAKERNKLITEKLATLNNENVTKFAVDKDARFGAKSKKKFWYGYKKHISVDMQSGMINKVAITHANLTDAQGFKHVAPRQGAVYADKGYCDPNVSQVAKARNFHLCAIKKNNMKSKNHDLDRWYSSIRAPYERVFSNQSKRTRYRSIAKNQFHAFMQTIAFNIKRLVVLSDSAMANIATSSLVLT